MKGAWVKSLVRELDPSYHNEDLHVCMPSHFSHIHSVTLWTAALQAPLSMRFSRKEYWSELPCPPLEDLPNPRIEPAPPALQVDSLSLRHWGSPTKTWLSQIKQINKNKFKERKVLQWSPGPVTCWSPVPAAVPLTAGFLPPPSG